MITDADVILDEPRVFIGVRMSYRVPEALQIVVRHLVSVGAQRSKLQRPMFRLKRKGINFDRIENVFSAKQGRKVVVDPGQQGIAAELPVLPVSLKADGFGHVQSMLARLPRQNR